MLYLYIRTILAYFSKIIHYILVVYINLYACAWIFDQMLTYLFIILHFHFILWKMDFFLYICFYLFIVEVVLFTFFFLKFFFVFCFISETSECNINPFFSFFLIPNYKYTYNFESFTFHDYYIKFACSKYIIMYMNGVV